MIKITSEQAVDYIHADDTVKLIDGGVYAHENRGFEVVGNVNSDINILIVFNCETETEDYYKLTDNEVVLAQKVIWNTANYSSHKRAKKDRPKVALTHFGLI